VVVALAAAVLLVLNVVAEAGVLGPPVTVEIDPGVRCRRSAHEVAAIVEKGDQRVLWMRCTTRDRLVTITLPEGEGHYEIDDASGNVIGRGASPDPGAKVRGGARRELMKGR